MICDPPAFVKSRKDLKIGAQGYRKLVRLAAPLVARGGFFFVASCSHLVDPPLFAEQVRRGLRDAEPQRPHPADAPARRSTIRCTPACPRPRISRR